MDTAQAGATPSSSSAAAPVQGLPSTGTPEATPRGASDREDRADAQDCVVIGGGPAGLTAAYELSKLDRHALVLEQGDLVGGISRTEEYRGYRFDIGGHRFFTKAPYVQELWDELLDEEFLVRPRLSRIFYQGKFFDYPLRPMNALRGLGFVEAVRIGLSYARSNLFPVAPERSFEDWVSNRFGKRLFQIFFKTYTEKVWGMPCSEISADWAAQRIKNLDLVALVREALLKGSRKGPQQITTLIEEFHYPRHGPGQMWEACVERLAERGIETRMQTRVTAVLHEAGRVRAVRVEGPEGTREIPGAEFLSTMPIRTLLRSLEPAPPAEVLAAAERLRYRDFLTVGLIVESPELFPDNWIYIHSPEVKLGRIQNFKNWSPHMVPDERMSSLGLEYFVQAGDELWTASDEDLIALGTRECEHLGLIPPDSVRDGVVIRCPKAYPVYDDQYAAAVQEIRDWLDGLPNLQLIGRNGQHRYNNQDHSMMTAVYAARNIAAGRPQHDVWDVNVDQEYHEEQQESEAAAESKGATGERLVPRRLDESDLEVTLRRAFARYDKPALGVALGSVGALLVLFTTLWRLGADTGHELALLGNYLPGYTVSVQGALLGAFEVLVAGFCFGWLLAAAINGLVRLEERKLLALVESRAVDLTEGNE